MTINGEVARPNSAVGGDNKRSSKLRKCFYSAMSGVAEFLRRPFRGLRDMYLAVTKVEFADVFSRASANYALWRYLVDSIEAEYPDRVALIKRRYRRFVVREAHWYFEHNQILARASGKVLLLGSGMLAISWTVLVVSVSQPARFIAISIPVGLVALLFLLFFTVSYSVNVGRVWKTGATAVLAGCAMQVVAFQQGNGLDFDSNRGYVSLSLLLYGISTSLTALAGAFFEDKKNKLWIESRPAEIGTVAAVQVISTLQDRQLGLVGNKLFRVRWQLWRVAACLNETITDFPGSVASQRGSEASRQVYECSRWLLLQQPGTADTIRDLVRSVAIALLTGYHHCLPVGPDWSPVAPEIKQRARVAAVGRRVASVMLPLAVVVVIKVFSLPLPTFMEQWAVALAGVWFVVKVALIIDPDFSKTWTEVREILSSRDSFGEQQRKTKGE